MNGWKVFTYDLRPPVQGGEPVWYGSMPHTLPTVELSHSASTCAAGWNFTRAPHDALRIARLWPTGRPSRLFAVEAEGEVVERADKLRTASLTIVREATGDEIAGAIGVLSEAFAPHAEWMALEQIKWRQALGRPVHDVTAVEAHLLEALAARGLSGWKLRQFNTVKGARDAWTAWNTGDPIGTRDAKATWNNLSDALSDAYSAREWTARDAWAWDAWDAWDNARWPWTAVDARAAKNALVLGLASRRSWVKHDEMLLTRGIQAAYYHGLESAAPTAANEIGWVMAAEDPAH